jgi:hypothetical protein
VYRIVVVPSVVLPSWVIVCNYILYDIPPIRFVFQVTQKDLRSSLMMAGYCRNMNESVYRIKEWYNQCILLVISSTSNMHGTNIKPNAHLFDSLLYCSVFIASTCFNTNASSSESSIRCLLSYMNVLMQSWWWFVKKLSHSILRIVKTLKR